MISPAPIAAHAGGRGAGGGAKQKLTHEQRAQVIQRQQQRLLLLRHSSKEGKCPAGTPQNPDKCRATPHCAQMKQLWQHLAKCKDPKCATPYCVSSRYVLSHYHRCKDQSCLVCGPVRQAIQREAPGEDDEGETKPALPVTASAPIAADAGGWTPFQVFCATTSAEDSSSLLGTWNYIQSKLARRPT